MNKRRKKILYFVEAMGGGVFTYITNLANNLAEEFDVYVAYGLRSQTPKNFKLYFDDKVHLIEVKNFKRNISFYDLKAFFEMKKIEKRINPDVIHLHSSKAGILGRWAFSGLRTPVFYTPHGYSFLMSNISGTKKLLFNILERISVKKNSMTIACSYGEKLETEKFTKRSLYVDNGIDTNEIDKIISHNKKKTSSKFTIYTLGRISTQKNPRLFNQIAEEFPMINFVWIGDGEMRACLTSSNIEITGWLNSKDALKKASTYDAFILTSKWEGLPMALLESMYMFKPCIVSNVIGNNNVIKNRENGYLCNNLEDYKQSIESLLSNENIEKITEKAYKDIVTHYNSKTMAKQYANIYKKITSI